MEQQRAAASIPAWQGWPPILVLPTAVVLLTPSDWPRWAFMWLLGYTTLLGCKWLSWRRTPAPNAPLWRHAGYLLAWPGLDAKAFLLHQPLPAAERPRAAEWAFAFAKLAAGSLVLWGIARLVPEEQGLVRGWVGMIGISMAMHFGAFHIISCGWRAAGIDAQPLMNAPLIAQGVSEFWGRRWNTAFRDLTHRFLFRPLTPRLGPRGALIVGFVFSGLIHELVISVPTHAGYGGPTLFFVVQIPALLVERSRAGKALGLGQGWRGWLFTALVLVLPAGLLFHPPFVHQVVLPFMQALGAINGAAE
jgi:alginate O-acetyltransferase complex protein AlgI